MPNRNSDLHVKEMSRAGVWGWVDDEAATPILPYFAFLIIGDLLAMRDEAYIYFKSSQLRRTDHKTIGNIFKPNVETINLSKWAAFSMKKIH